MELQRHSTETLVGVPLTVEYKSELESGSTDTSTHLLSQILPATSDTRSTPNVSVRYKALMIVPLVVHCLGSFAIVAALLYWLEPHSFYTERSPKIMLAKGTEVSDQLGRYNLLQSDVVTILSGALMLLRWTAGAWAGPLCWRAIFLLAENQGVRRQDIKWITSVGLLPPSRRFRHLPTLLVGIILTLSLIPLSASPLLTGSITWVPGNSTLNHSSILTNSAIQYRGKLAHTTSRKKIDPKRGYVANMPAHVLRMYNLAWSQNNGENVIRRVTPSVANLTIGSTVQEMVMPYLEITNIEWLEKPDNNTYEKLYAMHNSSMFPSFLQKLTQPGAAAIVVDFTPAGEPVVPEVVPLLLNVRWAAPGEEHLYWSRPCESTSNVLALPDNTTIPYFNLNITLPGTRKKEGFQNCFAYAKFTLRAGSGYCRNCRVTSFSTVQNETALDTVIANTTDSAPELVSLALKQIPVYLPTLTPFKDSLPDVGINGVEPYVRALITRLYSTLWTAWTEMAGYDSPDPMKSSYRPAYPTLTAKIDRVRAYTQMIAFDLDSTEVTLPDSSSKKEPQQMLEFEWSGDRWKAVVKRRTIGKDEDQPC